MSTSTVTRPTAAEPPRTAAHHIVPRLLGAALAVGVAWIHVKDQGGFPGDKTPTYVGIGYYVLEAVAVLVALALIAGPRRHALKAWLLAVGVAVGPLVGYVLSRGPGLPGYTDDRGNWTEPIGVASLIVEGVLLIVAAVVLTRSRRRTQ